MQIRGASEAWGMEARERRTDPHSGCPDQQDQRLFFRGHCRPIPADAWPWARCALRRPNGSLIDTLGRSGQDPGEFERLGSVQAVNGDTIYGHDLDGRRLSTFAPQFTHELVRTLRLEAERIPPYHALVTHAHVAVLYGTPFIIGRDPDEFTWYAWRRVTNGGRPVDTLFTVRMRRTASLERGEREFSLYPMPFERTMHVTTGPDGRFYVGRTDRLTVQAYRPGGGAETVLSVPTTAVAVTEAERDSVLEPVSGDVRSTVASALPETKPVRTNLVGVDNGRLWVRRSVESPEPEGVRWWILAPDSKTIWETRLPESVDIEAVQGRRAYGTTTTDEGAPAVVRYRIVYAS